MTPGKSAWWNYSSRWIKFGGKNNDNMNLQWSWMENKKTSEVYESLSRVCAMNTLGQCHHTESRRDRGVNWSWGMRASEHLSRALFTLVTSTAGAVQWVGRRCCSHSGGNQAPSWGSTSMMRPILFRLNGLFSYSGCFIHTAGFFPQNTSHCFALAYKRY